MTFHLEDRRSASLRQRNRAKITVLMCEQNPYTLCFSRRYRSQNASLRASSPGQGALAAGREKEGELATTSLKLEYLHRKSRCEMLIGGDDISNDVITLGTCFSMFVYIRARFRFALIGGNLTAQSTGSHRGIGGGIQIPETKL